QTILETYSGATGPTYAGSFTATPFGGLSMSNPSIDFSNPANVHLGDPGGWGQDGYVKFEDATDSVRELRLDAKRVLDNSWFNSVQFGVDFNKREKTRNSPEDLVNLPNGPGVTAAIPSSLIVGRIALPGGPTILAYNGLAAIGSVYQLDPKIHGDIYAKDWSVDEKVTTAYAQLNIDTNLGSVPLRGNLGYQLIHTSQSSQAIESEGGSNPVPQTIEA